MPPVRPVHAPPHADGAAATVDRASRPEDTWNLDAIYPSTGAFADDRRVLEASIPSLEQWKGRLGESASTLADALEAVAEARKRLQRLHAYASMRSDEDTRNASAQQSRLEIELVGTEMGRRTSYLRPELLEVPAERLLAYRASEPRLRPFEPFLRTLERQRKHVLGPAEEKILAEVGLLLGGPGDVFGILNNAEMPRPEITLSSGESVRLTPAAFSRIRTTTVRDDRRIAFEAYFDAYRAFEGTLGQNLFECLKGHGLRARVRRYGSCVEAALDADNIPVSVYRNLIACVREGLPLLHRYSRLRGKALGLPAIEYHDTYCPLRPEPPRNYDTAEAREMILASASPLGAEYADALRRAFAERWIDWHPGPGKRSGAYATGAAYDVHPYMLLNFHGDYESVSTLMHEAGHAMHSQFSNASQPFPAADYSIFVAEVASTFNEALLNAYLLRNARDAEERIFLLSHWVDGLRATLFRQVFFADFELQIHERTERGVALTGENLSELYLDLLRTYQGHDADACRVADRYGIEWAVVPHFYYDFYVYQYATGIVAATSLAEDVLSGDAGARDRYLAFLRSGCSKDPLDLLRAAGVDLESARPYDATMGLIARRLDELEDLLDGRP